MSHINPTEGNAVVVRAAEVERVGYPPQMVRLLADSSATGGQLSAQRVTVADGADGASPHHHSGSAELFYVINGSAQLLAGERLLVAGEGDLAVVPSGLIHALAAAEGSDADLLIVIAPGVERFEILPPPGQDRHRPAAAREPVGSAGPLRHLIRRQHCVAAGAHWPAVGFVAAGDRGSG